MERRQDSFSDSDPDPYAELSMSTAISSSSIDSVSSISTCASTSPDLESSSSLLLSGTQSSSSESSTSPLSTFSRHQISVHKSPTCFFDPSTCQHQNFSIPEKIVHYIAKNVTNAETYQKLVETCKYFFKVNPVIVVPKLISNAYISSGTTYYNWSVSNLERRCFQFKNPQEINFKLWLTQKFVTYYLNASELIPKIYKNDATFFIFRTNSPRITWEEFLFFAANAEHLNISNHAIKYENGETVTLEEIIGKLPKLKFLKYVSNANGNDITSNTFHKLMEIEHFKNISHFSLSNVTEELNAETMFNYILENKHVEINIRYRIKISDAYKERIREYSNRLKNEIGCESNIGYDGTNFGDGIASMSSISSYEMSVSSADNDSDIFSDSYDNNANFLSPWNSEDEEWLLPRDI